MKSPKYGETKEIIEFRKIIKQIIYKSKNDKYITENIMNFIFNKCNRCNKNTKKNLTYVISFNDGIKNYNFRDIDGTKYGLKKFCNECIYCNAFPCKIYVEVQ